MSRQVLQILDVPPELLTQTEGDLRYLTPAHATDPGDPHAAAGYLTQADADGLYTDVADVTAAINTHATDPGDPHNAAGYLQESLATTKGDLLAATAASTLTRLGVGANGQVLLADSAQPTGIRWGAAPAGGGMAVDPLADAKGDLFVATAADTIVRLGVGANGQALLADSAQPEGVRWGAVAAGVTLTGTEGVTATEAPPGTWSLGLTASPDAGNWSEVRANGIWSPTGLTAATAAATYEVLTAKGANSGYAPLDAGGLVPSAHMPPLAITNTFVVPNLAGRLGLTATVGDVCVQTDTPQTYILQTAPANVDGNWIALQTPGDLVLSVNGQTGVVNITLAGLGGITQAFADARYAELTDVDPFPQYHTAAEVAADIATHAGAADPHPTYTTAAELTTALTPYLTSATATTTYVPLAGGSVMTGLLGPTTTNTRDLGTTALRWRKLWAVDVESTNTPTVGGVALPTTADVTAAIATHAGAADPHPTYTSAAELATAIGRFRKEEFVPAAAATTVTVAQPISAVFVLTRNGVNQSAAAGDYSFAASTVTFTDALDGTERVQVFYLST